MLDSLVFLLASAVLGTGLWAAAPFVGRWAVPLVWLAAALLSTAFYAQHQGFAQEESWSLWLLAAVLLCTPLALGASLRGARTPLWATLPAAAAGALTLPLLALGALFLACSGGPGICPS